MYSLKKSLCCVVCVFLFSVIANAATLSGIVFDHESSAPLEGANVILNEGFMSATTDGNGEFSFNALKENTKYNISVSYLGYHVKKTTFVSGQKVKIFLKPVILKSDDVIYTTHRASEGITPVSYTNVTGDQLRKDYWAQDLPPLLENTPGVYVYSESGAGIGYTHMKVRGFDEKRIGVSLNGIPMNDPEDGVVYWVDIPDIAANIQDAQFQRGVSSSTNGASGLGGSLNLMTQTAGLDEPSLLVTGGIGSFHTRKWSASYNSGVVNNTYGFYGRFSKILTDGYRDNSASDLYSYFLSGVRYGKRSRLTINMYGGREQTHAAWYASAASDIKSNRRNNPNTYKNTLDDFTQPHYEIHHEIDVSNNIAMENSVFYIRGEGYYEQLKEGEGLVDFGYQPFEVDGETVEKSDFVNQKWVIKDHYGWVNRTNIDFKDLKVSFGGDFQYYEGDHKGYVIWGKDLPEAATARHQYYGYGSDIMLGGLFAHADYSLKNVHMFGDLEYRLRKMEFEQEKIANFTGEEVNRFDEDFKFLNPKFGVLYDAGRNISVYANAGLSHRAPTSDEYWDQTDWEGADDLGADPLFNSADTVMKNGEIQYVNWSDAIIEPERVLNIEVGATWRKDDAHLKVNVYNMKFWNEIIPGGGIKDGSPITDNAESSVHRGVELEMAYTPRYGAFAWLNASVSDDRLSDYTVHKSDGIREKLDDNRIALFPEMMISGGLGYTHRMMRVSLDTRYVGRQYLDNYEMKERSIDPFTLMGLTLSANLPQLSSLPDLSLSLRVNNLLDTEFETSGYYDSWYGENYYFVGASRNYFLTLSARL